MGCFVVFEEAVAGVGGAEGMNKEGIVATDDYARQSCQHPKGGILTIIDT